MNQEQGIEDIEARERHRLTTRGQNGHAANTIPSGKLRRVPPKFMRETRQGTISCRWLGGQTLKGAADIPAAPSVPDDRPRSSEVSLYQVRI